MVGLYFSAAAVDLFIEAAYDGGGLAKTRFVNIVEGDLRILQRGRAQAVAEDILGEDGTAGADKGDLGHGGLLVCLYIKIVVEIGLRKKNIRSAWFLRSRQRHCLSYGA